jgi:hypothetical protein
MGNGFLQERLLAGRIGLMGIPFKLYRHVIRGGKQSDCYNMIFKFLES